MIGKTNRPGHAIRLTLASAVVVGVASIVSADSEAVEAINRAKAMNQVVSNVTHARLALERWNLVQLESLRKRGFASWLEVEGQKLLVEALIKRQAACEEYSTFLEDLQKRANLASRTSHGRGARPGNSNPPIKVSLLGSVRLIGWIETDQISSNLVSLFRDRQTLPRKHALKQELERVNERLSRAESQFRTVSKSAVESEATDRVKRAELQLDLARAELRLLQNQHQAYRTDQQPAEELPADLRILAATKMKRSRTGTMGQCVSAADNVALWNATLRVAAAEAHAAGNIEAAEIMLERKTIRYQAVKTLTSKGHASRAELEAALTQVDEAKRRLEQFRDRQAQLKKSYETLKAAKQWKSDDELSSSENVKVENWHLRLFADPMVVRHLVELRRHNYEMGAQREALVLQLAMLKTHFDKLHAIAVRQRSTQTEANTKSVEGDDFHAIVLAARQRELDLIQLDIRFHEARLKATKERLQALALEEKRFIQQTIQQRNFASQTAYRSEATQSDNASNSDGVVLRPVAFKSAGRDATFTKASYLEAYDSEFLGNVCELAFSETDIEIVKFVYPSGIRKVSRRTVYPAIPSIQIRINRLRAERCFDRLSLSTYSSNIRPSIYSRVDRCLSDGSSYSFSSERLRFRTPSYSDAFHFGIRRVDLPARCRPTPGYIPWYLPGSPMNFR